MRSGPPNSPGYRARCGGVWGTHHASDDALARRSDLSHAARSPPLNTRGRAVREQERGEHVERPHGGVDAAAGLERAVPHVRWRRRV